MEVEKIKVWLKQKGTTPQFEVLESKLFSDLKIRHGHGFYITKIKRLKDDKKFSIGNLLVLSYKNLYYKKDKILCIYITRFHHNLIHVNIEIVFQRTSALDTVENLKITCDINDVDNESTYSFLGLGNLFE